MGVCNCKEKNELIKDNADVEVPSPGNNSNKERITITKPSYRRISSVKTFIALKPKDEKKYNSLTTERMIIRGKTMVKSCISNRDKQLTRSSSMDHNKPKLAVTNNDIENIKSMKSSDNIELIYSYTNKEIEEEEEIKIFEIFKAHPLFKQFTEENLLNVIDNLSGYQIKKGSIIYQEGEEGFGFYIIKKGSAELIGSIGKKRILSEGDSFGELALLNKCIRLNTVIALEDMQIYMMERELYRDFTSVNLDDYKSTLFHLNSIPWIKTLDVALKNNLAYLAYSQKFEKDEIINLSNKNPKLYIVEKGQGIIYCKLKDRIYNTFEYFGECFIFPQLNEEISPVNECFQAINPTNCCVIEKKYLEEFLGFEYKDIIKICYLKALLTKSVFFPNDFLHAYIQEIDKNFTFHFYNKNEVIFEKNCVKNKKFVLILEGSLIDMSKGIIATKGELFGEEIVNTNVNLQAEICAFPNCLVIESSWKKIRNLLKRFSQSSSVDIFKRINKLMKFSTIFQSFSESQLIALAIMLQKEKFEKGESICTENSYTDKFYLINSGRVKFTSNCRFLRELDEGCSFGVISLLNEENHTRNAIAASQLVLYTLNKEYFFQIMDDNIMEYIRNKIYLEDDDIKLEDLYYITFIGKGKYGNVCLVHNKTFLYSVKFVQKRIVEKQKSLAKYIIREKEIMLSVSHPFIVKLVKTLKTEQNLIYLMEYINGINMEDYINKFKPKKDLYQTAFYTACILLAVEYLHKKFIVHRDIKPANILIDKKGYIKLIDFGGARVIKDLAYTLVGTPHFTSPEVLTGKGYSFSCDLWSIAIIMYNLYFGILPFGNSSSDIMDIYKDIINKEISFPDHINSSEICKFLTIMLDKKQKTRFSELKIISGHGVFQNINWEELIKYEVKPYFIPKDLREWSNNLENLSNPIETAIKNEKFELNYDNIEAETQIPNDFNKNWFEEF